MELALLLLFAIWPMIGMALIRLVNQRMAKQGRPDAVRPARSLAQVLSRMYLWPILIHRGLKQPRT